LQVLVHPHRRANASAAVVAVGEVDRPEPKRSHAAAARSHLGAPVDAYPVSLRSFGGEADAAAASQRIERCGLPRSAR